MKTGRLENLKNQVVVVSGGTRGIGLAIAKRVAREGAQVAILGKTVHPHPKLEGTLESAREEIEKEGSKAIALPCDIRDEKRVDEVMLEIAKVFGRIDALVNNASAIQLTGTLETDPKRYDLMQQVNGRGTFMCSRAALPFLKEAPQGGRILTLSPPLDLEPQWFGPHLAYSLAKFSMSLCTLGLAEEFKDRNVAANSLWPRTIIDTAAIRQFPNGAEMAKRGRPPSFVAEAACAVLKSPLSVTGQFFIDEEILSEHAPELVSAKNAEGLSFLPDLFVHPSIKSSDS